MVVAALSAVAAVLGAVAIIRLQYAVTDPFAYTAGVAAFLATACAYIALLGFQRRALAARVETLEAQNEALADGNWELREDIEHAQSLLEAQGDLLVRRDAMGRITYANHAYCNLAGKAREALVGTMQKLPVAIQANINVLPDGSRTHDQKIGTGDTARWIAWHDVTVRSEAGTEIQSVGRDMTARTLEREPRRASRRDANRLAMVSHDPHAAERHSRHERSPARRLNSRPAENYARRAGRNAAGADRMCSTSRSGRQATIEHGRSRSPI